MYNWNVDLSSVNKKTQEYRIWYLNQLINFGLNGEKLDLNEVKRNWNELSLDPKRKVFLRFLIWNKRS